MKVLNHATLNSQKTPHLLLPAWVSTVTPPAVRSRPLRLSSISRQKAIDTWLSATGDLPQRDLSILPEADRPGLQRWALSLFMRPQCLAQLPTLEQRKARLPGRSRLCGKSSRAGEGRTPVVTGPRTASSARRLQPAGEQGKPDRGREGGAAHR